MTATTTIRDTLAKRGVAFEDVRNAHDGGAEVDPDDDPTMVVQTVERHTMLAYQGERDGTLRFDWAADAPKHRSGTTNPRAHNLRTLADAMDLSRGESRRAVTGLHHSGVLTIWKGDRQTTPIILVGAGHLPEAETGIGRGVHTDTDGNVL